MITVVGLGPAGIDKMSMGAHRVIRSAPIVFVRTARHPAGEELAAEGFDLKSLDDIYESAETFEDVYVRIAEKLLTAAEDGDVVYAVPGHPLVGESSVELLVKMARERNVDLEIMGSASFIEASLEALNLSLDSGLKIMDALSLDKVSPARETGNLIYQVYDREIASDVKLKLMECYPDGFGIAVISAAGTPAQRVYNMPLYELDRHEWDHLITVYVPPCGETSE